MLSLFSKDRFLRFSPIYQVFDKQYFQQLPLFSLKISPFSFKESFLNLVDSCQWVQANSGKIKPELERFLLFAEITFCYYLWFWLSVPQLSYYTLGDGHCSASTQTLDTGKDHASNRARGFINWNLSPCSPETWIILIWGPGTWEAAQ